MQGSMKILFTSIINETLGKLLSSFFLYFPICKVGVIMSTLYRYWNKWGQIWEALPSWHTVPSLSTLPPFTAHKRENAPLIPCAGTINFCWFMGYPRGMPLLLPLQKMKTIKLRSSQAAVWDCSRTRKSSRAVARQKLFSSPLISKVQTH